MARRRKDDTPPPPLPSREAIRDFIRQSTGRVGKREVERAFRLGPEHRVGLRTLLKDLAGEGVIAPAGHRRFTPPGRLPDAQIVQITGTDPDGDAIARPVGWEGDGPPPMVLMAPRTAGCTRPGARVSACWPNCARSATANTRAARSSASPTHLGACSACSAPPRMAAASSRPTAGRRPNGLIAEGDTEGALDGEIVLGAPLPSRSYGLKSARV